MYEPQIREKAIADYQNGVAATQICKSLGVSRTCLYKWLKLYKIRKDKTHSYEFTYSQFNALKKKYDKLNRENEILRKAYDALNLSLSQKLKLADDFKGDYPVKEMCRAIGVNHSTFYNHDRRRAPITRHEMRDEMLKSKIMQIHNESGGRFGAKKILQKLKVCGVRTSLGKVSSLMSNLNIKSRRRNSPIKNVCSRKYFCHQDKLRQNFNQPRPDTFWVGDVTYIKINGNTYYLCVIMDLFSRKIIAHDFSTRNSNALTVGTFKKAFEKRNNPQGLTFHSDQGSNYTSNQYRALMNTLKVDQSFSKRGTPYDNAVVEAFFSNLKRDDLHSRQFEYFDELRSAVEDYIDHYNSYRPHETLNLKTPNQIEEEYFNALIGQ